MSKPYSEAAGLPVNEAQPIVAFSPVVFDVPGRLVPLEMKVTAPVHGERLPVILLSHGHGASNFLSSLHGYAPVAEFWAAHGFVVIQPTHLDSTALGLQDADDPQAPLFWRSRAEDMLFILDHLADVESAVPLLGGRLDTDSIAVVGHSLGGHTASLLLGMRTVDPSDGSEVNFADARVKVGVVMTAPGIADEHSGPALQRYPVLADSDFTKMTTPALVIGGDKDLNPVFSTRLSYRWDAYTESPAPKTLLIFINGEHILGGISGFDNVETTDENPERVAAVRALTWAYLRSALDPKDRAWPEAVSVLEDADEPIATVETKK